MTCSSFHKQTDLMKMGSHEEGSDKDCGRGRRSARRLKYFDSWTIGKCIDWSELRALHLPESEHSFNASEVCSLQHLAAKDQKLTTFEDIEIIIKTENDLHISHQRWYSVFSDSEFLFPCIYFPDNKSFSIYYIISTRFKLYVFV